MSQEGAYLHRPVMVREVLELLSPVPSGVVVDATVGGGGHAEALLEARGDLGLLGLDRDPAAVDAAGARLARFGRRAAIVHRAFAELDEVVAEGRRGLAGTTWPAVPGLPAPAPVTGVLADLGVSSFQLDRAARGFSYRNPGPLDMRMDPGSGRSAADLVNTASADELAAMLAAHGEARLARRLARAIVAARPIETTDRLAQVVAAAVPAPGRRRGHPARRVFQALRVEVNEELAQLDELLSSALALLALGGRAVVLAYHSGEDRLVKQAFARAVRGDCQCPPGLPCVCGAEPEFRLVARGSRRPAADEVAANHRAESARLRVIERVAQPATGDPAGDQGARPPGAAR